MKSFLKLRNKEFFNSKYPEELILIYGSFFIYFIAHSIMWWKGLANSLGLLRVLAGVMPPAIILVLRGLNLVFIPYFEGKKIITNMVLVFILVLVTISPFQKSYFPFKLNAEDKVLKETIDWFQTTNYTHQKVYYLSPYLAHLLNIDSFDSEKVGELWGLYPAIDQWGIDVIPDSTIVIWDAHFGPNECKIPLEKLMSDPNFQLLNSFKPKEPFQVLGGYNYEVNVFIKLPKKKEFKLLSEKIYDFEENLNLFNVETIDNIKPFSGTKSCKMSPDTEFSITYKENTLKIPYNTSLIKIKSKIFTDEVKPLEAYIVMSIDSDKNGSILWENKQIKIDQTVKSWQETNCEFYFNKSNIEKSNVISIYFWNRSKESFFIDDLIIEFWGQD